MKKAVSFAIVAVLIFGLLPFSLFSCGNIEENSKGNPNESKESITSTEEKFEMIEISGNPNYKNVALNKHYEKSILFPHDAPSYPDEGDISMTDGVIAPDGVSFSHNSFMGFNKNSSNYTSNGYSSITVDLGGIYYLDKFVAHVGSKYYLDAGINAPEFVWIYLSNDGENWYKTGRTSHTDTADKNVVETVLELDSALTARYVQYRFVGDSNWIMVCEVEAYGIEAESALNYPEEKDDIKMLFVGNSSIYYFNTPIKLMHIAEAAGLNFDVTYCTIGNAYLNYYADENDELHGKLIRNKLKEKKYDIIMVHDNSGADYDDTKGAMDTLVPLIKENGGELVLYKRYSSNEDASQRLSSATRLHDAYTRVAEDFGIEKVAPVADAFLICYEKYPEINLHHTDNSHHNNAGAYLIACVWAITYLGLDITDNTYTAGLDEATVNALKDCAKIACEVGYDFPANN